MPDNWITGRGSRYSGASNRRATPVPCGNPPSMAAPDEFAPASECSLLFRLILLCHKRVAVTSRAAGATR